MKHIHIEKKLERHGTHSSHILFYLITKLSSELLEISVDKVHSWPYVLCSPMMLLHSLSFLPMRHSLWPPCQIYSSWLPSTISFLDVNIHFPYRIYHLSSYFICLCICFWPDNHDGVITHLEPDILECEVKWAFGSITTDKASWGDGIPVWAISNPKRWCSESAALNMPATLENSAVATGLEKVSFHSNP